MVNKLKELFAEQLESGREVQVKYTLNSAVSSEKEELRGSIEDFDGEDIIIREGDREFTITSENKTLQLYRVGGRIGPISEVKLL